MIERLRGICVENSSSVYSHGELEIRPLQNAQIGAANPEEAHREYTNGTCCYRFSPRAVSSRTRLWGVFVLEVRIVLGPALIQVLTSPKLQDTVRN